MRINKYIAAAGVASRRKADVLIENGNVKVNGAILKEKGTDIVDGDVVEVNNKVISPEKQKIYLLLNKPVGYVTTTEDELHRPTVMQLMTDVSERIFPVGRLDVDTSGLLLLTNDGDLANRLMHPSHKFDKTYRVVANGIMSEKRAGALRKGVDIGEFVTSPAKVEIIKYISGMTIVDISIHEGKNRQVRRMFKVVGNPVKELQRTAIGDVKLGRLKEGSYRKLKREELESFK